MDIKEIGAGFANAYLIISNRSALLVDTGIAGQGEKILTIAEEADLFPQQIVLIVLTHCHTDHFGSLPHIKELTGSPVAVHRNEKDFLSSGRSAPVEARTPLAKLMLRTQKEDGGPIIDGIEPEIIIDREYTLNTLGFAGKIIHTPGHTDGSLSVFLEEEKTAFIGDLVMRKMFVFGKAGLPAIGRDMEKVKESLRVLLDLGTQTFYASHGGKMERAEIERLI